MLQANKKQVPLKIDSVNQILKNKEIAVKLSGKK